MSKYIKLEDAIRAIAEQLCWEARTEYGDKFTTEDWLEEAEDYVSDLPTIEMIDTDTREFCKSLNPTWDSGYVVGFNDGRKTEREHIEVSEDCISRRLLNKELDKVTAVTPTQIDMLSDFTDIIKNAPSVVPTVRKNRTVEQSSMVGEDRQ